MTKEKTEMSYDKAIARIGMIVEQLEEDDKSMDELEDLVKEASMLIKECRQKLKSTEEEINKAFTEGE